MYVSRHPDFPAWAEAAFEYLIAAYRQRGKTVPTDLELFAADIHSFRMSHGQQSDVTSPDDGRDMDQVSIDEACGLAGVKSRRQVHRWIHDGLFESWREGRYRRIDRSSFLAYLESRR